MHTVPAQKPLGIGIVLLAAGSSSRLGQPKQLLTIHDTPLIRQTAGIAIHSGFSPIVVVLGAHKDKIIPHITDLPLEVVDNDFWEEGMGTSVKVGVQQLLTLRPQTKAIILMLCDQPFVDVALLHKLALAYQTSGRPIVASQYGKVLGVPALFDQQYFTHLTSLQGNQGARKIIKQHAAWVESMPFEKGKYDIDTMADYHKLQQMLDK